ncbi:hypothetical protein LTR35_017881 [Friedmanniomyces endolithicus]|uniref:Uncharacterized protein n=1 Tax=Friedmanniomyces endolithicus TaxID=329885 RepID=A0AAN6IYQ6_9PEZI|nr:hypothetical protein LTR35_017881 [Friedmanniomyces endolithicus]KAK0265935.1 hypothetical protein LTS00_017980 [Friedmanniomyces endolithicus]KAK0300828.1 hypothetical protein LTR82_018322 [Friedmanniomyces endolithicus]
MSLAAAKLARQEKRIEQAALSAPLPSDRDRQAPRAKRKKTFWVPLNLTADTTAATQASEVAQDLACHGLAQGFCLSRHGIAAVLMHKVVPK